MTLKSNGTDDGHVVTCDEFFTLEAATERCRPCSGCGENAHVKLKCTSIRDTRCECDRDHYWDAGKGRCRPCDLCPHGWGAMRACTPYRNSACRRCPSGTYSAVLSTSLACFPCTACKARQTMVQACNRIQDTVCSGKCPLFVRVRVPN